MSGQPGQLKERFAADDLAEARRTEFENILVRDRKAEWRLFWSELIALMLLIDFAIWALSLNLQGR
jgi:hypothetical protein